MNAEKQDEQKKTLSIMAVGDISFGDHYFSMGHGPTAKILKDGPESIFAGVRDALLTSDICFGNLEGVVSHKGYNSKSFSSHAFRGHPLSIAALQEAGFNLLNVANNHICQHGIAPAKDTLAEIKQASITVVGKLDGDEYHCEPVTSIVNGLRVGVLGYSMVDEVHVKGQKLYAEFDESRVIKDIIKLKEEADLLVLSLHFGEEAVNEAHYSVRSLARTMVDAGADILLGHHPHVFHEVEKYKGAIISYSLGNFVFDLLWDDRLVNTAILNIELKNDLQKEVILHPVKISKDGLPKLFGSPIRLNLQDGESYSLYPHKTPRLPESFRKTLYLVRNLYKGNVLLKMQFLWWKISTKLMRKRSPEGR